MGRKGRVKDTPGRKNPEVSVNVHWRDKRNETEGTLKHTHPFSSFSKHSSDPMSWVLGITPEPAEHLGWRGGRCQAAITVRCRITMRVPGDVTERTQSCQWKWESQERVWVEEERYKFTFQEVKCESSK